MAQVSKAEYCVLGFPASYSACGHIVVNKIILHFHMQCEHPCCGMPVRSWVHIPCGLLRHTNQTCDCHQRGSNSKRVQCRPSSMFRQTFRWNWYQMLVLKSCFHAGTTMRWDYCKALAERHDVSINKFQLVWISASQQVLMHLITIVLSYHILSNWYWLPGFVWSTKSYDIPSSALPTSIYSN